MKTFKSGRGGVRPGAGRPKGEPKKPFNTKLPLDIIEWIQRQPNQGAAIEKAIRLYGHH